MTATSRRWLARASFALMFAAVALVLAVAGWRSLTLVAFAVVGVCAVLAGLYWFLANRGVVRWLALLLAVAAPILILVAFALASLLWVAIVAVALMLLCGRRGPDGANHARRGCGHADGAGGAAAAPFPDHEPEVRRREGHEVRAEREGAATRSRRRHAGGPGNRGRGRPGPAGCG